MSALARGSKGKTLGNRALEGKHEKGGMFALRESVIGFLLVAALKTSEKNRVANEKRRLVKGAKLERGVHYRSPDWQKEKESVEKKTGKKKTWGQGRSR